LARKKKKKNAFHVIVKVLQNGTPLSESHYPVSKNIGVLKLSNHGDGPLVLPHYPFPDNSLEFMRLDGKHPTLLVNYKWEGFSTSNGELVSINRRSKGIEEISLSKGDYGSISYKDVRIMFKLEVYKPKKFEKAVKRDRSYIPSLLNMALPFREEKQNFASGFVCSLAILGIICGAMFTVKNKKPRIIDQLPEEYTLPFIEHQYFGTAPERLQTGLDRDNFIPSVLAHYRALSELIYDWGGYDKSQLFNSTVKRYEALNLQKGDLISSLIEVQRETDESVLSKNSSALLLLPAITGETVNGQILRGIDKMNTLHEALVDNLERRVAFTEKYAEINMHEFEEYKNVQHRRGGLSKLSKIKPWERLTDEQMMYKETTTLSENAVDFRYYIEKNIRNDQRINQTSDNPILIPTKFRYGSGLGDVDFMALDEKLYVLEASEFGGLYKEKKIREPLIGELDPKLVSKYIKKHRFQLQQCYELALRRNERAEGTMEWTWRIDSRGKISEVSLLTSSIADQKMSRCIQKYISRWRFPRPRRGSVMVRYPFNFSPAKG
jgi:hypothetical protein